MSGTLPAPAAPIGNGGDPPGSLWLACPECGWLLYVKRLRRNLRVCPECSHHLRLPARERIGQLVDEGSFDELRLPALSPDPLRFTDRRPYPDRLREASERSGESEAVVIGSARLGGLDAVMVVMDFDFLGGSMGVEVGRRVAHAAQTALERRVPLISVCASGGARMQEGVLALAQMARTGLAFGALREAGLLSVCILTDPTYGGVSASFAALGCVVIAEQGAHIGFAGPRVVQQTIRQQLPPGFQTAEFLLAHGLVDRVESRADLRPLLIRLIGLHSDRQRRAEAAPPRPREVTNLPPAPERTAAADPWEVVQAARNTDRPTTLDYFRTAFDDFVELHGDRAFADDPALVTGLASLDGRTVVVMGHQKGRTVRELVSRNFGMPHPEGYRKALRLLGHAERHRFPIVTLVDTPGAHPGLEAEQRGQFIAIAEMIRRMSRVRTPVVSVVTGEGGSGGALALCAADRLLMLEHSYLSVISPEGCAAILWRQAAAPQAARALRLGPERLRELGVADRVIAEPTGGAQADPPDAARRLREAIVAELDELASVGPEALLAGRMSRLQALDSAAVVLP